MRNVGFAKSIKMLGTREYPLAYVSAMAPLEIIMLIMRGNVNRIRETHKDESPP